MKRFKTTTLAAAALLVFAGNAWADATTDALKKEIDELRRELQELKKGAANAAPAAPAPAAAATPEGADQETIDAATPATQADIKGIRADFENYKYETARTLERKVPSVTRNTLFGGTIAARYSYYDHASQPGVSNSSGAAAFNSNLPGQERRNGFDIPMATFTAQGQLYRDYKEGRNLSYKLGFSYASNFGGNATSSTSGVNTLGQAASSGSQWNVTDAFLQYSLAATNAGPEEPVRTLTLGQQQIPFGLEAQVGDEVRPVINSAQFLSGFSNIGSRQIGLIFRGDDQTYVDYTSNYRAPFITYAVGIVNGNGPNKSDNNNAKDYIGRIQITPDFDYTSWFRQVQIGASVYKGENSLGSYTASTGSGAKTNVSGRSDRYGLDLNYTHFPYSVAYEYVLGKDYTPAAGLVPAFNKIGKGQYVNFAYTWGEQFLNSSKQQGKFDDYWPLSYQAFLRYDVFDADTRNNKAFASSLGDKQWVTTLGLNAYFAETTKLQFNLVHTHNQAPANGVYTLARPQSVNAFLTQFQFGF